MAAPTLIKANLPGAAPTPKLNAIPGENYSAYEARVAPSKAPGSAPAPIVPITPDEKASAAAQANLLRVNGADANTAINSADEYRNSLSKFQAQIDSTNAIYNDMLNKARIEGQSRLGTNRAEQARGGLLGSDFGTAQTNEVNDANSASYQSIEAKRAADINGIMGQARTDAATTLAAKTAARKSGAEAVAKYYTETAPAMNAKRVETVAKALYAKELDPSTMTPAEMTALTNEWNVSPGDLASAYSTLKTTAAATAMEAKKTQAGIDMTAAQIKKIDADIASGKLVKLGEGETLYDPSTGVVYKNPKTAAPGQGLLDASRSLGMTRTTQLIESAKALEASRLIGSQVRGDAAIQNFQKVAPIMSRLQASHEDIATNGINQSNAADLLDAITQINTGGKVITEGQISLTKDSQSYADEAQVLKQRINGSGGVIDPKIAEQATDLSSKIYALYQKQYQDHVKIYNQRLKSVNGQDLTAYSPLTDITQLPAVLDGSYDTALSGAATGDAPATDTTTGDPDYDAYMKAINGQ